MPGAVERLVLVTDANVLINFCHVRRLDILGRLPGYRFLVPAEVEVEITDSGQREQVAQAFREGHLALVSITAPEELQMYAECRTFAGKGEAACLAIALNRGYAVASDDRGRKFFREVTRRLGRRRIMGTVDLTRVAIRSGCVTAEEADGWIDIWRSQKYEAGILSFKGHER